MLASALGVIIVSAIGFLLMLVMTIAMVASLSSMSDKDSTAQVKQDTFLTVEMSKISGDRTAGALQQSFGEGKTVGLIATVDAIRRAADDDRVKGLLLKDDGPTVSWASLEELRSAIALFRESGKPVVSYATAYTQPGYYLCSAADAVCLHPSGMVEFRGMGGQVMYYKDLLDKLGVEMQLIRPESCAYKSAGEVYIRNNMSDANREQIRAYIASIWRSATADIAASRNIAVSELNSIADNLSGFLADDACAVHLVDTLCFEEDVRAMLRDEYGGKHLLSVEKYVKSDKKATKDNRERIAVIYAEGNVVDGSAKGFSQGVFGDDIVKALHQAADDPGVKAIVLRVNSPGGQATASESMTSAVIYAKQKKPVVVSMGDLAASAGYEISCMADAIVAERMTITGSIGVFGTVPNFQRLMRQKLGLNVDTVLTNRNAASLSVMAPLKGEALAMMTRNVEDFYKVFVGRVAEGRHMTYDAVHEVARGRVWTGADALRIGLVDTLGGLDLALRMAADKAGVSDYAVKEYPLEKDVWTQLSEMFGENSDTDLNLFAKMRMAWMWKAGGKPEVLTRLDEDLRYVGQTEGLHARLPYIVVVE